MTQFDKTDFTFKPNHLSKTLLETFKQNGLIKGYYYTDSYILINSECLSVMKAMIENNIKVNHIITDVPYGTVQGLSIEGWKNKGNIPNWDIPLDSDEMIKDCFYVSQSNANVLLFAQEPLTTQLINASTSFQKFALANKMIWIKNNHANGFTAKTTPLNYYEEILLFRKSLDETNSIELRLYFKNMLDFIKVSKKDVMNALGQGLDHCFRYANRTFYIPTEKNYDALIQTYGIDKMNGFIPYPTLKEKWESENKIVFNLPKNQKIFKNVLEHKKDTLNIHPTQKPLSLLKELLEVFTNENDTVLDFTSGSGSLGIACSETNRKFIGIEINEEYYKKSIEWFEKTIDKSSKCDNIQ